MPSDLPLRQCHFVGATGVTGPSKVSHDTSGRSETSFSGPRSP